jgi:hypothetical protein
MRIRRSFRDDVRLDFCAETVRGRRKWSNEERGPNRAFALINLYCI